MQKEVWDELTGQFTWSIEKLLLQETPVSCCGAAVAHTQQSFPHPVRLALQSLDIEEEDIFHLVEELKNASLQPSESDHGFTVFR